MENEKIGFFKRIKIAIFNLEDYDIFAVERTQKSIIYLVKLIVVFILIASIGLTYSFVQNYSDMIAETNMQDMIVLLDKMKNENIVAFYISSYISSVISYSIIYTVFILFDILMLSVIGMITSKFANIKIKYDAVFNVSIYSITLPILLNLFYILLNCFTGFNIKNFGFMYNAISYIYVITAILMIKSEMIRQELELMKIVEEQKKIKEEMERQEQEKKQKEEQKRKEREKEKDEEKQEKPSR